MVCGLISESVSEIQTRFDNQRPQILDSLAGELGWIQNTVEELIDAVEIISQAQIMREWNPTHSLNWKPLGKILKETYERMPQLAYEDIMNDSYGLLVSVTKLRSLLGVLPGE